MKQYNIVLSTKNRILSIYPTVFGQNPQAIVFKDIHPWMQDGGYTKLKNFITIYAR